MGSKEHHCHNCGAVIYFDGICYRCRQRAKREAYQALTDAEIAEKVTAIIAALDDDFYQKPENEDFLGLLAYKDIATEKIADAALAAGVYYPCEIYRDASAAARGKLIALLSDPECGEANHILQCLAIAGGGEALAAFIRLEKAPLPWSKFLHVPPSVYAQAGGWTFGKDGELINLNFCECYPVYPAADSDSDTAISAATPRDEICPQCGSRLMDILTLDGGDSRLAFLRLPGVIRIPVCPSCATMCERTIARYTPGGDSAMELLNPFGDNGIPESEYAAMTKQRFALAKSPEPLFFARGNDEGIITIGGFASWIQDFQYDICPDCGKTMRYLASVPWDALSDYSEGTLYLEICTDCGVISAHHQQT